MFRFNSLGAARAFRDRVMKAMRIIMMEDALFAVVTMSVGERFITAGYEEVV